MTENGPKKVFVSYSHKDKKWVRDWLLPRLENAGIPVHIDFRDFEIGPPVLLNIERAVEQCSKTVVVLTPDWVASQYTNFEGVMLQTRDPLNTQKKIMPLVLVECDLPRRLEILTWADFREEQEREAGFERLVAQIRRDLEIVLDEEGTRDGRPLRGGRSSQVRRVTPSGEPQRAAVQVDVKRLPETGYTLFGRQREFKILDDAWQSGETNVMALVAYGGTGKSILVNKWVEKLRWENYRGARRVYGWSFYSQGTGKRVTSADQFIGQALKWFGDSDPTQGSAWDKGARLAALVRQEKTLLVLDGMEPLQAGDDFEKGKIRDPVLSELVKQLARQNDGLCVITTREKVDELERFETGVMQLDLEQISKEAGRALLRVGGVQGTDKELEAASEAFGNHALAISLLATYLHGIEGHHVSSAASIPDLSDVPLDKGRHPRRVIEAFAARFGDSAQTQILKIMGLFDRPPEMALIDAVKADPPIGGLTDKLGDLDNGQWHDVLDELRECRLLAAKSAHNPDVLDCHPLIREHSADKLKNDQPDVWRVGHKRLYEYLTENTEHQPDDLVGLQPLYQAVAHGCLAGMQQKACDKVYRGRIVRGDEFYSTKKLGAIGSDLAVVACFFERPWTTLSGQLSERAKAWLLVVAAFGLQALGRLTEALEPMRAGLDMRVAEKDWSNAAIGGSNLSDLELTLGHVIEAVEDAERSVGYADRSGAEDWQNYIRSRRAIGTSLFQAGQADKAAERFREAEAMQAQSQPECPVLYSLQGFRYCDLLLAPGERAAWRSLLQLKTQGSGLDTPTSACNAVEQRATQTIKIAKQNDWLLDIGLDHLSLGRAALFRAILEDSTRNIPNSRLAETASHLGDAVDGLRRAGQNDELPKGLLSRALLRFVAGDAEGCRADLEEAGEIAERGSMKLHMADVHLHRARLFRDKTELAQARKLIEQCGYGRRKGELEDAEEQIKG